MNRLFCFAGTVLAVVLTFGAAVSGAEPNPRPARNVQPGAVALTAAGNFVGIPGYPTLSMDQVQKELGLTPEQKEKLKEVAKKAAESMQKASKFDWTKFRDMKPEEQQKAQKEIADRYAKQVEETRKDVEHVLTLKQVEQLKEMEFRQRAAYMLYVPQVLQDIKLTDEQQQQMQKIREETQSKMARLQRESQEKTLKLLTPEQTKKLKELSDKGWPGWGRPVQLIEPKERPKGK